MTANPLTSFVPGAPVQRGATVQVIGPGDETCDKEFIGHVGKVEYLEYECGCGQTFPGDPMIGVSFGDGRRTEFWFEELSVLPS